MSTNYRQKYKKHYGIDFSSEYEIHHLDLNHDNNSIDNLLLLPKELHRKYHEALLNCTGPCPGMEITFDAAITGNAICDRGYQRNLIKQLIEAVDECDKWYDYKLYLGGVLPNIHGITLEDK